MRKTVYLAWALAGLAMAPHPAFGRDAQQLEPSSQWVLDYADERCTLARTFGHGDDSITLQIISYGDWNGFHTILTGPLVPRPLNPVGSVRATFPGDTQRRDPVHALEGSYGTSSAAAFELYFGDYKPLDKGLRLKDHEKWQLALERDRPEPDFDRQVETISFEFNYGSRLTLHVENMAAPLAALRKCVDDLYRSWTIDPEVQKNLTRLPRPLPQTVYKVQTHYPLAKLASATNGYVRARLLIDANGQAKSCIMQVESVDEDFKKAVCNNLMGRFEPALDKDRRPVESMYYTAVAYLME